ncbi:hypothetical protein HTZ84_22285 [Haloterrigena sp. SYSU A558-1]|uniref:Secreted protein n=1 Tax=Haloterrigena gelatinilytica TaxID=2741724 RepID=A0ABX2LH05_9EURY|nr:hypothetical protein [Haloterrigena gelatinilytica]NUC74996.1 hypothetical protein [Haloterrigena gelatinilytica]
MSDRRTSSHRFTALTVGLLVVAMALGLTAALVDDTECTAELHYQNGTVEEVPATVGDNGGCVPDREALIERGYWNDTPEGSDDVE